MNAKRAEKRESVRTTPRKSPSETGKSRLSNRTSSPHGVNTSTSDRRVEESGAEHLQNIREVWKEEIAAIQSTTYASLDQAMESIVSLVTARLGGDEDTKAFLELLIATDPSLQDEIRDTVRITSRR